MQRVIAASDFDVEAFPTAACTVVELSAPILPDGGSVDLPVIILRGAEVGPKLAVTAGVHGDEYEGPAAAWMLAGELDPASVRGTLLLLPQANPLAAASGMTPTPEEIDDADLNSTFPGNAQGRPTERLAAVIWRLLDDMDFVIDLHSGGMTYEFLPAVFYYETGGPEQPLCERVARCFGIPAIWIDDEVWAGTLVGEMARRGRPAIGCEQRGGGRLDPKGVQEDAGGIQNAMAVLGMLERQVHDVAGAKTYIGLHEAARAPASGLFCLGVRVGDRLCTGAPVGTIIDPRDGRACPVAASRSGVVLSLLMSPTVTAGDWVANVGLEREG